MTPEAASISKAAFIRLGAPTHGQDQDQRYIPLNYTTNSGSLTATSPANANIAPPGYYMLFLIDSAGVPSVSKMVQVANIASPTGIGTGLTGQYFNNMTLAGSATLQRTEAINFNWGTGSPGAGIGVDRFSVRWSGQVEAPLTGSYQFQTLSDDGIRVSVNGQQIINNWTDHGPTTNTSAAVTLTANTKYNLTVEFYENGGGAVASLSWKAPGSAAFAIVSANRLYARSAPPPTNTPFASTLVVNHTGQCLDVPNASTVQAVQLQQFTCNGTGAQLFDFSPVSGKTDVCNIINRNSGLCLDISGATLTNGAQVVQWACNTGANQQYLLTPISSAGAKAFQVKPQHSNKCVEIVGASQTRGALAQQWDCGTGTHQIWTTSGKP